MKNMMFNRLKIVGFVIVFLIMTQVAVAQRPIIREVSAKSGSMTELITLKGNNFGTDATKLSVFFGATKCDRGNSQVLHQPRQRKSLKRLIHHAPNFSGY